MQEVYKAIGRVASKKVNVLILGESGTGKELVAQAIQQHSPRAPAPFLAVNCAAIPEPLLESELSATRRELYRRRLPSASGSSSNARAAPSSSMKSAT